MNIFGETVLFNTSFEVEGEIIKIYISNLAPSIYFIRIGDKFEKFVKF
jgi:hypothetical protein